MEDDAKWLKKTKTTSNFLKMEDNLKLKKLPKTIKSKYNGCGTTLCNLVSYFVKHLDGLPDRLRCRYDRQVENYSLFQQKHQVQLVLRGKKTKTDFCFLASNYLMKAPKLLIDKLHEVITERKKKN